MENQYLKYMGRNEVKRTKDLEQIINNLSTQIDTFKTTVGAQSTQMTAIQQQMEQYRQASDAEKQRLQAEINRLHQARAEQENQRRRGRKRVRIFHHKCYFCLMKILTIFFFWNTIFQKCSIM